jgi:ribosomal protein S18 acetylase RimI-like enzyme
MASPDLRRSTNSKGDLVATGYPVHFEGGPEGKGPEPVSDDAGRSPVRSVPRQLTYTHASVSDARVRDASPDDAEAVTAIGKRAVPAQYEGLVDHSAVEAAVTQTYSLEAIRNSIQRCVNAPGAEFLVAEHSQQVVGFLHYDCFGPEPELHRLYLDSDFRSGGVGSRLIEELHSRLPPGSEYMLLVLEGNDRAVRFYKRHGLRVAELSMVCPTTASGWAWSSRRAPDHFDSF